jgi:hypothetical protein
MLGRSSDFDDGSRLQKMSIYLLKVVILLPWAIALLCSNLLWISIFPYPARFGQQA